MLSVSGWVVFFKSFDKVTHAGWRYTLDTSTHTIKVKQ